MPTQPSLEFTMGDEPRAPVGDDPGSTADTVAQAPYHASAPAVALEPGSIVGGRYAIEKAVGHGAFGSVYRASDVDVPGHVVALKMLHQPARSDEAREIALRELRLIASVFHPSVVSFKDSGWHEGRLWFVMPWYDGETLKARLERAGSLTRAEAHRLFVPLARGLAAMHASRVRHQDIKPDNIFLARVLGINQSAAGGDELPVLLDLGVAATDSEHLLGGTIEFFAPEVAAMAAQDNGRPATAKADVFSLALSLRNALEPETAEVLGAESAPFVKHRAGQSVSLPVRSDLRYLQPHLRRWLALDPDQRPSADLFADELAVLIAPEVQRERRRNTLRVLVPAMALVLGLAAMLYALVKKNEAAESLLRERAAQLTSAHDRRELDQARAALVEHELRERLERTQAQESISESTITQLQGQISSENLSNAELVRHLADATGRNESLRGMLGAARTDLATANTTIAARQADLVARQAELDQARADLAARTGERDQVRTDLATRTTERDQLQTDLGTRTSERDQARTELAQRTTERDQLTASLARAETELSSARSDLAAREHERDQARADLAAAAATRAQLTARIEQLEHANAQAHSAPAAAAHPATEGSESAEPPHEQPAEHDS